VISPADAETFARCISVGGVAVFPADTVYGLACEPDTREAVQRLYALKGRRPDKPSAIMFFDLELAFAALPELEPRTRTLLSRLMPGGITALLPNPLRRFPLACGAGGGDVHTLGLRVPALEGSLEALAGMRWPVLQSSANASGGVDAQRLEEVPEEIRGGADLVLDGGELAGTPSTVVDLRRFELDGMWAVLRQGAVPERDIELAAADA
jgi:L-threonylcarbamoyladenylate synthase